MAEKMNTMKDFDQSMVELGLSMIDDYYKGIVNDNKLRLADKIIQLYQAVKVKETPVNTNKSK